MRRIAYWLFPTIAILVAVFIVVFMIQINPAAPTLHQDGTLEETVSEDTKNKVSNSWIDRFHLNEENGYFYPVNEVTIQLDTGEAHNKSPMYRMVVPLKDSYEFFCLKQELKNSDLPYLLNQEGDSMKVLIDSADHDKLTSLVTKLKTYQISATVSPFKED